MQTHELMQKLSAIRRRMRLLLAVDGTARLIAAVILAFVFMAFLDWWVRFPSIIRTVFLIAACAWITWWSYRRIIRPLIAPVHLDQMALALNTLSPEQRDGLATVASHERAGTDEDTEDLWSDVSATATAGSNALDLRSGLTARRPLRSIAGASLLMGLIVLANSTIPEFLHIGARRIARPFTAVQWPRLTRIEPLAFEALVAHGDTYTCGMRLDRGDGANVRGFIHWRTGNRPADKAMMRRDPDGVYRRVIENVVADTTIWYTADDDDTLDRPVQLHVVRRPSVLSTNLIISPPEYARHLPQREDSLADGRAMAVRGSRVRLEVQSDKPVVAGEARTGSRIMVEGSGELLLRAMDVNRRKLFTEFPADASIYFEIILKDDNGFESRGGQRYQLEVTIDQPPSVVIKEPTSSLEILPGAAVEVRALAEDDVGIEAMTLLSNTRGSAEENKIELTPRNSLNGQRTKLAVNYVWNVSPLKLAVGNVVEYFVEAQDGYQLNNDVHKPARSAVMRLTVVSTAQFSERLHLDVLAMRGQLRKMLNNLEIIRSGTKSMEGKALEMPSELDLAAMARMTDEARKLVNTQREAQQRLDQIVRRALTNKADDSEPAKQAQRLERRMSDAVGLELARSAEFLAHVNETRVPSDRRETLAKAGVSQEMAIAALKAMVDEVERWDSFDEMVRKLQELIDRQEAVTRETTRLSRLQNSPNAEVLLPQSMELVRAATEQSGLQNETTKLLTAMEQMSRQLAVTDRPASESLAQARQVGIQRAITDGMAETAEAIRGARMSEAANHQERVGSGLRAMLIALNEKPQRELEQLSRRTQDSRERLRKIMATQEELIKKNAIARNAGDPSEKLGALGDRQSSLENTTQTFADGLANSPQESDGTNDEVNSAVDQMASAAGLLRDANGVEAEKPQHEAVIHLTEALKLFDKAEQKTQETLAEKSMATIVEQLKEVRQLEAAIRDETSAVVKRSEGREVISRVDGLAMNRLAKRQAALNEPLTMIREKIAQSVVYVFVLGEVIDVVESAAKALLEHKCGDALAREEKVVLELGRLIDAVDEPQSKEEPQFSAEQGGAGGSTPTAANPVPTLAELKMLRIMQIEVNERTTSLARTLPEPLKRTEEQLVNIGKLGRTQRNIHELAVKMTKKPGDGEAK